MSERHRSSVLTLFAAAIFTSAFLLFQVQPLISKFILPWFGGSPTVWSTCMLFFQLVLLGGYLYAHVLTSNCSARWQAIIHVSLLLLACVILPITPSEAWKPQGDENPALLIVGLLSVSVGLPYFILSTTGPLLQRWFSLQAPGMSPYRLYALSNVGSLLALVSYPFVVEPAIGSSTQAGVWSVGFVVFGILCAICAVGQFRTANSTAASGNETPERFAPGTAPNWGDRLTWLGLAAVASTMLLATTNQMCLDVATVPFLWILPLSVYLVSFILTFDADRWYSRRWCVALLVVALLAAAKTLFDGSGASIIVQVGVYTVALFLCCMVCHGELARQKPDTRYLTQFFVLISAGGAVGGLFVGLIAPAIFPAYWELHIGIIGCLIATLAVFFRDRDSVLYGGQLKPAGIVAIAWVGLMAWTLQSKARDQVREAIETSRNFYGVLRVEDTVAPDGVSPQRILVHGSIVHGAQFLEDDRRRRPTAYFSPHSGVGLALTHHKVGQPRHIGVVGLGIGTLAAYGQESDTIRFYEINPEVVRLAEKHFTYLDDCPSETHTVVGDGRLALEYEDPQQFDILILDAFSGDACPTHLLTQEAADIYARHLKPDGVLCFNISNLHFDLRGVVKGLAEHLDLHVNGIEFTGDVEAGTCLCHWMVMSREPLPSAFVDARQLRLPEEPTLWTDQWSNLLTVLR